MIWLIAYQVGTVYISRTFLYFRSTRWSVFPVACARSRWHVSSMTILLKVLGTSQGKRVSAWDAERIQTHWLFLAVWQATPSSPLRYGKRACGESSLRTIAQNRCDALLMGQLCMELKILWAWWEATMPSEMWSPRSILESSINGIIVTSNHVQGYNSTIQILPKSLALWILILFMLSVLSPGIPMDNTGFEIAGHIAPSGQLSSSSWSWLHPSMVLASGVNGKSQVASRFEWWF